jgi:hypothetical protein
MNILNLTMLSKIIQTTLLIIIKRCLTAILAHSLSPHSRTTRVLPQTILNSSQIINLPGRINNKFGTVERINPHSRHIWFLMYQKGIGGKKKRYLSLKLKLLLINVLSLINRYTLQHFLKKRRINNSPWWWILVARCATKHSEK